MTAEDEGYAWVIRLCFLYFHVTTSGAVYSIKVFSSSWVDDFGASKGITSWMVSVVIATCFISGEHETERERERERRGRCAVCSVQGQIL